MMTQRPARVRLVGSPGERFIAWTWKEAQFLRPKAMAKLWDFLRLAEASDETIVRFATRWGVLELCEEHRWPATHNTGPGELGYRELEAILPQWRLDHQVFRVPALRAEEQVRGLLCSPVRIEDGWFMEPIEGWRQWARRFEAALRLVMDMGSDKKGRGGTPSDWELICDPAEYGARGRSLPELEWQINHWGNTARLRPSISPIRFREGRGWMYGIELSPAGLFGVLVAQLFAVLTSDNELHRCDRCNRPYASRRKPYRGRSICPGCKPEVRKAQVRAAVRRHRGRPTDSGQC